jgi:hypothetical protein
MNFSTRKCGRWDEVLIVILLEWLECVEHFLQYKNASLKRELTIPHQNSKESKIQMYMGFEKQTMKP